MSALVISAIAMTASSLASHGPGLPSLKVCGKAVKETVEWKEGATSKKKSVVTGAWEDKECSKADTTDVYRVKGAHPGPEGKYELLGWEAAKKKAFKGKGLVAPVQQLINPLTKTVQGATECTKESQVGEIIGPKTDKLVTTYEKCKALGKTCETPGAGAGKIVTKELVGELVYLSATLPKVGVLVKPKTGSVLAEYNCEGTFVSATGALIGEHTGNVNKISKTATNTFTHGAGVGQQWAYLEEAGGGEDELEYYVWGAGFKSCVTAEVGKGHTLVEAEGICFGKLGPFPDYPTKPTNIISILSGAHEAEAPSTQNTTAETKGEADMVEA
jgi:hypothetical protein